MTFWFFSEGILKSEKLPHCFANGMLPVRAYTVVWRFVDSFNLNNLSIMMVNNSLWEKHQFSDFTVSHDSLILSFSEWYKFSLVYHVSKICFFLAVHFTPLNPETKSVVQFWFKELHSLNCIYRNMNWNSAVLQIGVYSTARHFLSHLPKFECAIGLNACISFATYVHWALTL